MFHPFVWYSIGKNKKYLILVGRIDIVVLHEIDDVGKLESFECSDICKRLSFDPSFLSIRNRCNWCWCCNP